MARKRPIDLNDPLTSEVVRLYCECLNKWGKDAGMWDEGMRYDPEDFAPYSVVLHRDDDWGTATFSLGIGDEGGPATVFVSYRHYDRVDYKGITDEFTIDAVFQEFDTESAIVYGTGDDMTSVIDPRHQVAGPLKFDMKRVCDYVRQLCLEGAHSEPDPHHFVFHKTAERFGLYDDDRQAPVWLSRVVDGEMRDWLEEDQRD